MNSELPHVFTIILNWNQPEFTLDCLDSVEESLYPRNTVVLVDNGSTDGSPEIIRTRFPGATIIENPQNKGYSEGNNIGIQYALDQGADYIFLLNNDTLVDPKMLSEMVQVALSDPDIGIIGPTMFYIDPPDMLWGGQNRIIWHRAHAERQKIGERLNIEALSNQPPAFVDYIDSCAILIKREVLEKIGLMDSKYFINYDDLDLNLRAKKAGYKIVYVPRAVMWHKVSAAMGQASPATTYYMIRNSLLFFWTHTPAFWKIPAISQILFRSIRTLSAWTIKEKYRSELFARKRNAGLLALKDFFLRKYGKMGPDAAKACFGK
jgi:GT2 family glycosyltransferase